MEPWLTLAMTAGAIYLLVAGRNRAHVVSAPCKVASPLLVLLCICKRHLVALRHGLVADRGVPVRDDARHVRRHVTRLRNPARPAAFGIQPVRLIPEGIDQPRHADQPSDQYHGVC